MMSKTNAKPCVVYAEWHVTQDEMLQILEDENELGQFHISCGKEDEQWTGYFLDEDEYAQLTITRLMKTDPGDAQYELVLEVPSQGHEVEDGFWVSANILAGTVECTSQGWRDAKPKTIDPDSLEQEVEELSQLFPGFTDTDVYARLREMIREAK
jgi:hypothetical protein